MENRTIGIVVATVAAGYAAYSIWKHLIEPAIAAQRDNPPLDEISEPGLADQVPAAHDGP